MASNIVISDESMGISTSNLPEQENAEVSSSVSTGIIEQHSLSEKQNEETYIQLDICEEITLKSSSPDQFTSEFFEYRTANSEHASISMAFPLLFEQISKFTSLAHRPFSLFLTEFKLTPRVETNDWIEFIDALAKSLSKHLKSFVNEYYAIRLWASIEVQYVAPLRPDLSEPRLFTGFLRTKSHTWMAIDDFKNNVFLFIKDVDYKNKNFLYYHPGLHIRNIVSSNVIVARWGPCY